ncbi:MAG: hypothetical protein WDK96_00675 [Candidatus Paceibacterota bacterium]|jgi:hypothetical protein
MRENIENKVQINKTEEFFEGLNPDLWKELSSLSQEEQDDVWFNLTQKHLKDFKNKKENTKDFRLEEMKLMFLNQLSKNNVVLDKNMPQKGFYIENKNQELKSQKIERFGNFGNLINTISEEVDDFFKKDNKPFQLLVGGIGISGKATTRRVLTKELSDKYKDKKIISWDRDYEKIFPIPEDWQGDINVIEDVHGLDEEIEEENKFKRFNGSDGLPNGYNMIIYVLPSAKTFKQSMINRGMGWLEVGKLDLTAPDKEYAKNKKEQIKETAEELDRFSIIAKEWFKEQLRVLRILKDKGVKIAVVDPSEIFKKLYGFEYNSELLDKSYLEALEILTEKRNN